MAPSGQWDHPRSPRAIPSFSSRTSPPQPSPPRRGLEGLSPCPVAAKYGASLAGQVGPPPPESPGYGDSPVVMEPIARGRRSLCWAQCPWLGSMGPGLTALGLYTRLGLRGPEGPITVAQQRGAPAFCLDQL